jgi:hypothetical protein
VQDRVTIEAGSFFERVPPGGDVYLLSRMTRVVPTESAVSLVEAAIA